MRHEASCCSPLVATEFGVGFWDSERRELRLQLGTHVSPLPREMRDATPDEAIGFFTARGSIREQLTAYYATGRYTGD